MTTPPHEDPATAAKRRMQEAESLGLAGNRRAAYSTYLAIARDVQRGLGQFHPLATEAYEHMARWVAGGRQTT